MKTFLTVSIALLLGLAAGFSLRSSLPLENYQQALEADFAEAKMFMMTLQKLDSGDVAKARSIGIIPVLENLESLRYYSSKGWATPTPEQKQKWQILAKETLDYMLRHKDEWDPRLISTRDGIRALGAILSKTENIRDLSELTNYLAGVEQKIRTSQ